MYQRVVAVVAGALFALIAVVSGVMTDLHDRSYPEQLGASSALYLDFGASQLSDTDAFATLGSLSRRGELGLVRILPDVAGDTEGQVFVPLDSTGPALPPRVTWYGDQPAGVVRGPDALTYSFASGQYLVTGTRQHLDDFETELTEQGVRVRRVDDTVWQSASFLVRQESFRATLTGCVALLVAMALFWLSVRSRGRALRVLAGVRPRRIHAEDLGRLAIAMALPAIPITAVAVTVVAVRHGSAWLPYYAATLVGLEAMVIVVALVAAACMSAASWPTVRMLATRQPAVRRLARAAGVLKVATFLLVLLTVGPAWWAYGDAQDAAEQQATWRSLSDQVALRFPAGLGEDGFVEVSGQVGRVVAAAERSGTAALSYAMTPDQLGLASEHYDSVVLVNEAWLALMGTAAPATAGSERLDAIGNVDRASVPADLRSALAANLDLWARAPLSGQRLWQTMQPMTTTSDSTVPMAAAGNGDLVFPRRPLLLLVPSAADFTDDFLASLTSTNNVVFNGLDTTLALLQDQGLGRTLQVKYAAEDGVLRAQYAGYDAWLRGFALLALAAAFVLGLGISAFIAALIHARRDFPLRLDGQSWAAVLRPRVAPEVALGLVLGVLTALLLPPGDLRPTGLALVLGLGGGVLAHRLASAWSFHRVAARSI